MDRKKSQADGQQNAAAPRKRPLRIPGGLFIVFEGIDGTGKTTQIHLLAEKLEEMGYAVVTTREPTDGPYGRKIRQLFVDRNTVSREEELELFIADRKQHVDEVIAPALADGCVVVCDRYFLSTVAYQGANGIDQGDILRRNETFPVPDLAVILEMEPAQGIHRIQNRRNERPNTFEEVENLEKVAGIFAAMQQEYIRRVNGSDTIENVHRRVFEAVREVLARKGVSPSAG
jgi:dTMP kinase